MPDLPVSANADGSPALSAAGAAHELMPLPKFIVRLADGIYVALPALESSARFLEFIDRLFTSGLRFVDLDYACLQKLLYDCDHKEIGTLLQDFQKNGQPPRLRLATDIAEFPVERRQYYRDVKIIGAGEAAQYLFEPVLIERPMAQTAETMPTPDDKAAAAADAPRRTVTERVVLNVDEFIAAMWSKQVRFGIDVGLVNQVFARGKSENLVIANCRMPSPGQDASVEELLKSLHRDNRPKLLPDGRVDLSQFQNRFPQVEKDVRLVRKVPSQLGKSGWDIGGHELACELPRDIDIVQLAGPGTKVERTAEGEFVVATISGFLQIDSATNSLSISEKIVNRDGVSLRTTGNLTLSGDEYEEHGEVEEHTQIDGKHMTFMANVFGNIVSHGGKVVFKQNMTTGTVKNPGGSICIEGNASRATLEAIDGEISVHYAEGSLIIGKKVTIGRAIGCDILAEELVIEASEGCALAGHRLDVGSTASWREFDTAISMPIPDFSAFALQLDQLTKKQDEHTATVESKSQAIAAITGQQDIKNYSVLNGKLRAKEITMTREQDASWQKLLDRVAPLLRQLKALSSELQEARTAVEYLAWQIQEITKKRQAMSVDIHCKVSAIDGETVIRSLKLQPDAPPLHTLQPRELRTRLREFGPDSTILYSGSGGEFGWRFSEDAGEDAASAGATD